MMIWSALWWEKCKNWSKRSVVQIPWLGNCDIPQELCRGTLCL